MIMMSDQESKYLPITKLMQNWIMIRTKYVNTSQTIMKLI